MYVFYNSFIEFNISFCICVKHNGYMKLVEVLLGVSSVFDDFVCYILYDDFVNIVLLFMSQFCFVFFFFFLLKEIAVNGIRDWHTILISSIQHLRANFMNYRHLYTLWTIK